MKLGLKKRHHRRAKDNPPMDTSMKIALWTLGGVAVVGGLAGAIYLYKKKSAPQLGQGAKWMPLGPTDAVQPGDRVRISLNMAALTSLADMMASKGTPITPDAGGLNQFASQLPGTNVSTSGPGFSPPGDWPKDDPDPVNEFHADFTYTGSAPKTIGRPPCPVMIPCVAMVWVAR